MVATTTNPGPAEGFLSARFHVISGENPAEFDDLVRDYRAQLNPDGPVERFCFLTIVLCDWKKRRFSQWEAQFLQRAQPHEDGKESPVLKSITSQLKYLDRTWFRAYRELRKLQLERLKASAAETKPEPKPESEPEPKSAPARAAAVSPQTGGIGFVSQKSYTPVEPQSITPAGIPHYDLTGRKYDPDLVFVG